MFYDLFWRFLLLRTGGICGEYLDERQCELHLDAIARKLRDLHLKTEQEQGVRNLYLGKDVLAVLPTGLGKSRIYQAFSLLNSCENTGATLIVIAILTSIIEDQLADLRSRGFLAAALSSLSSAELEECSHWCYCCWQQSFLSL